MDAKNVLQELKKHRNPQNIAGMARFGINPKNTLGISIPLLRILAKRVGKNHGLAQGLWQSGIHEARILATLVDEAEKVTEKQMDQWAADFDSWDVCDQVCMNLFDKTPWAYVKATLCANKLMKSDSKSARWIASDALREFAKKSKG